MRGLRYMFGCTLLMSAAAVAAPQVDVIASGLKNPRGLAFAPDGTLFVTEAGVGGNGECRVLSDGQTSCYGETGSVLRLDLSGRKEPARVLRGLPSLAAAGGFGALGPQAIAFTAAGQGKVILGLASHADAREGLGRKAYLFGRALDVPYVHHAAPPTASPVSKGVATADVTLVGGDNEKAPVDFAAYEDANDPGGEGSDSNPIGITGVGTHFVVADAGGNSLLNVAGNHAIGTLATFGPRDVPAPPFLGLPPGATIPMQAVPTGVASGPDGAIYVGQLTGFPFPVGAANIYRVPAQGGTPAVHASGFTNIIGLAFDASDRLYVLQIGNGLAGGDGPPLNSPGKLIRLNADGTQTVIYDQLFYPGGLAIGPDGAAYVTNFGIVPGPVAGFPTGGQVLRITLD